MLDKLNAAEVMEEIERRIQFLSARSQSPGAAEASRLGQLAALEGLLAWYNGARRT
jgi:hypothetical protein